MPITARKILAPLAFAASRVRSLFATSPASTIVTRDGVSSDFQTNSLRWLRSTDSRVISEIRSVLGTFSPRLVGLRERLMMRDDPDVALALTLLRAPLINLPWTMESEDDEAAAYAETIMKPVYRQLATAGSLAIHFGSQVVAKEYEIVDRLDVPLTGPDGVKKVTTYRNAITYKRFKAIDPRTVSILLDPSIDDWGGIEQSIGNGDKIVVGREGAAVWVYRRQDVWGAFKGYPNSDQAYDPWYTKHAIRFLRNKYFERRATPPWKGRAGNEIEKGGTTIDGFQYMHDQLAALKDGGSILLPGTRDDAGQYQFDAEIVMDDKRGDMFQQAIDSEGTQILRGYLITDKAGTSDGTGAFAMAQQHAETMAIGIEGVLREWLDDVVNPQVIEPAMIMMFGLERAKSANVRMCGAGISESLRQIFRDVLLQIFQVEQAQQDGQHVKLSDRIDGPAIAQQLGVPLLSEDDVKANMDPNAGGNGDVPIEHVGMQPAVPGADPNAPVGSQQVQVTQDAVLNGAQIQAAIDIVKAVEAGEMPRDAGLGQLAVLFNLTDEQAKKIMGSAGTGDPKPKPVVVAQVPPAPAVTPTTQTGRQGTGP